MKIVLLQDKRGIGKKFEVKEVNDGYARNFLFPNKIAKPATPDALKEVEHHKAKLSEEETALKKHIEELKRVIGAKALGFFLKTGADGSVFGSVNKEAILKALRETGLVTKERVDVDLDHPIKELGERKIKIRFRNGAEAEIRIVVKPQS